MSCFESIAYFHHGLPPRDIIMGRAGAEKASHEGTATERTQAVAQNLALRSAKAGRNITQRSVPCTGTDPWPGKSHK